MKRQNVGHSDPVSVYDTLVFYMCLHTKFGDTRCYNEKGMHSSTLGQTVGHMDSVPLHEIPPFQYVPTYQVWHYQVLHGRKQSLHKLLLQYRAPEVKCQSVRRPGSKTWDFTNTPCYSCYNGGDMLWIRLWWSQVPRRSKSRSQVYDIVIAPDRVCNREKYCRGQKLQWTGSSVTLCLLNMHNKFG